MTPVSRKRKRIDRLDEPVNSETDAARLESRRNKNRGEFPEEDWVHRLPYPDPAIDESLSEQSCRALSYAYGRCRGIDDWKFNKAKQNWLLRNVRSEQAVPENYIPLVIKYLKLIEECTSKMLTSEEQGGQPSDNSTKVGTTINQQPNTSRAQFILHALHKGS
ncbi:hypothetical protein J3R83DRAFT_668 [Lanmaoa asiatica]|nr:hypothetical protein J3R83DRAFT_668 [Lanmaoa asiatica]